jgi:hypothetical protein
MGDRPGSLGNEGYLFFFFFYMVLKLEMIEFETNRVGSEHLGQLGQLALLGHRDRRVRWANVEILDLRGRLVVRRCRKRKTAIRKWPRQWTIDWVSSSVSTSV